MFLLKLISGSVREQVRLLKSELDQRQNGTDGVQNPEGGALENGVDSNLLDMQSKFVSSFFYFFLL